MSVHIPTCKYKNNIFSTTSQSISYIQTAFLICWCPWTTSRPLHQRSDPTTELVRRNPANPAPPMYMIGHMMPTVTPSGISVNRKMFNHCLTMANLTHRKMRNKHPYLIQFLAAGHRLPSTSWQSEQ